LEASFEAHFLSKTIPSKFELRSACSEDGVAKDEVSHQNEDNVARTFFLRVNYQFGGRIVWKMTVNDVGVLHRTDDQINDHQSQG
jgi:hypothetical protein